MTMDCACRNIMTNTNCGIAQAFFMAATTPARAIGIDHETGSVVVGKKADLFLLTTDLTLKKLCLRAK